jgi:hypothetical protein
MGENQGSDGFKCCGAVMALELTFERKGTRVLRCVKCDETDPLKIPANMRWIDGELRPPT